jgi:transposase-like protein
MALNIVPQSAVFNGDELLTDNVQLISLIQKLKGSQRDCLEWLATRKLIKNSSTCSTCNSLMTLQHHTQSADGFRWHCRACTTSAVTVRRGSIFENVHLPLSTAVLLMYFWSVNLLQKHATRELNVNKRTVIDMYNKCRRVCTWFAQREETELGGMDENGNPVIVEVDESKFFHRKYNRGRNAQGHWVLGVIERGSGKCVLKCVQRRDETTLRPILENILLPGTHVITDGWRAYRHIEHWRAGVYTHDVVIHDREFVSSEDSTVHTNNCENMWMRAKRKLKYQFGTSDAYFASYLDEFVWRSFHKQNHFLHLVLHISVMYQVDI